MRRSEKPTEYIIVKAQSKSEWDQCDFALVQITPEWKSNMRERLQALGPFRNDLYFYAHTYWEVPLCYFNLPNNSDSNLSEIVGSLDSWAYVDMEADECEKFDVPENVLDTHMLTINQDGGAYYKAYGKHSGEEFYTDTLDLADLC